MEQTAQMVRVKVHNRPRRVSFTNLDAKKHNIV